MARARITLFVSVSLAGACATLGVDDNFEPPDRPVFLEGDIVPQKPTPWRRALMRNLPRPKTLAGGVRGGVLSVAHGGVGSPMSIADGPQRAAEAALARMYEGGTALEGAVASTAVLEDDPRFNAGTGANIRLDGQTIQMDAALMTGDGGFAAVGVIERVKNPIRVAQKVLESPHVFLAGEGATRFAHKMGLPDIVPTSTQAVAKLARRMKRLKTVVESGASRYDWRDYWNFPGPMPADMQAWRHGGDTVGTVTRGRDGEFAVTLSTGGTSVTLYGRVGDVPVFGAGTYAGAAGAVACTGHGETIIRKMLARRVYEAIASGLSAADAVHKAIVELGSDHSFGLIAVDRFGWGVAANRPMAFGMAGEPEQGGAR